MAYWVSHWGYYYAALHVAPDGPVLFYVQQTPCVNKHGVPIDDWYVVGNGGTSATAVRRRVGGRGHEWFDEELSERRVSYESAVPEMPAVAVSREPDASINSDLAGNDAVCSTCPSRPSP